jgi:hypothetical protein
MGRSRKFLLAGLVGVMFNTSVVHAYVRLTEIEGGLTLVENVPPEGPTVISNPKTPLSKCGDGGCVTERAPKTPPPVVNTPAQIAEAKRVEETKAFDQAVLDSIYEDELEKGDAPLEGTSVLLDKFKERLKEKVNLLIPKPPIIELIEALDPEYVGTSRFDEKQNKDEMKLLRGKLDLEKQALWKTIDEENKANEQAYQENLKTFKLDGKGAEPKAPPIRGPASIPYTAADQKVLASLQKLAALKSDDFGAITEHIITRGYNGADLPISESLQKQIGKTLAPVTRANVCLVKGGSCFLAGASEGDSCYCPQMISPTSFKKINGIAFRADLGKYCRKGDSSSELDALYPIGVLCNIPVDLSPSYGYQHVEFIRGKVSQYSCESWAEKHSEHCE